jgi:hypothetical protein
MLIGSCVSIHFWKWAVSNRVDSTEATCGCGRVSLVFIACWSAALCLEFRKFLLGALHLLARPWLGYLRKAEKERMLNRIMGSSENFKYGQLLC